MTDLSIQNNKEIISNFEISETEWENKQMLEPQTLRISTRPTQNPSHLSVFICSLSRKLVD